MDHGNPTLEAQAQLLRTLAHPARLYILQLLRSGEVCVCHIQAVLGERQATISQHLMALRAANLVRTRKEGLRVFYRIAQPHLLEALDSLRPLAIGAAGATARRAPRLRLMPSRGRCTCPRCQAGAASLVRA